MVENNAKLDKKMLRIVLNSDLCSGSGYSYAGVIDSDVCYDEYGLPYIPGKRLKGCFRETMESILYVKYGGMAEDLFGKAGDRTAGDFVVGNAYIEGYEDLKKQLAKKTEQDKALYNPQNILAQFTHVVGQTKLEDGVALDDTLRYTRVVNQYSPFSDRGENLVFTAPVSYPEKYAEAVSDCVLATRHIGLKRNRGFGNVQCSLTDASKGKSGKASAGSNSERIKFSGEKDGVIYYRLENIDPLMLSGTEEDTSRTYITGQSVIGALASRYLSLKDKTADSEEFRDLFLNGTVKYTNLYPCDRNVIYYPAPNYINRLKKTKKYVNVISRTLPDYKGNGDPKYNPGPGNQPKKLKGKYVSIDGKNVTEKEVVCDVTFHHSHHKQDAGGNEGILYSLETIRPGQSFGGSIIIDGKSGKQTNYRKLITDLLNMGDLYFGKSKSSQYGRCKVSPMDGGTEKAVKIDAGKHLVVTFLSDALIMSERGEYTVYKEELDEAVKKALGIETVDEKNPEYVSTVLTTAATGYLGVWNLRKSACPAVAAGSCLVYKLGKNYSPGIPPRFLGERNLEGYGQIMISKAEDMKYEMTEGSAEKPGGADAGKDGKKNPEFDKLMERVLVDAMEDLAKEVYAGFFKRPTLTNTALGRITLMLRESLEECKNPEEAFREFARRVDSIKTKSTNKEGKKYISAMSDAGKYGELGFSQRLRRRLENTRVKTPEKYKSYDKLRKEFDKIGISGEEFDNVINAVWGDVMMYILTLNKYEGGE